MTRKSIIVILIAEVIVLTGALLAGVGLYRNELTAPEIPDLPETTGEPVISTTAEPAVTETLPVPPETTIPEPEEIRYMLSFAGDCTLGNFKDDYGSANSFMGVVGDRYDYPFANVRPWFGTDDFTIVNFEGTLTNSRETVDKEFNFHGPPEYAKILRVGSVEAANLANNHTYDYGYTGYLDTIHALEGEGIPCSLPNDTILYTTERGLVVGVYSSNFCIDIQDMPGKIAALREAGAEIVIVSVHWGIEREYLPTDEQQYYGHMAIDSGADIVFGHHTHVLEPIEQYGGGIIFYSMGNFCFGGNIRPGDMDSAIIQMEVIRDGDGNVRLGNRNIIPCAITSDDYWNNYQPTPYPEDSEGYRRVIAKLAGTYTKSGS